MEKNRGACLHWPKGNVTHVAFASIFLASEPESMSQEPLGALDTSGKVLKNWDPETPSNWSAKIAWTTLAVTTYSLFLAFMVWFLVTAIAPKLNEIGFNLSQE